MSRLSGWSSFQTEGWQSSTGRGRRLGDPALVAVDDVMVATAVVRMAPGSEPASGSDCANAVVFSPRRTGNRYFSFCAGLSVNRTGFTSGPSARRQRNSARDLFPHQRHAEEAQPLTTIFRGHVE